MINKTIKPDTVFKAITATIDAVLENDAKSATKVISEKYIVRATRTLYGGRIARGQNIEITMTLGKPNSKERAFINLCKKAKEPFPIRNVGIKFPARPRGFKKIK